jgi:hypothetical protein
MRDGCRWVRTANGQAFARTMGIKEPPMSLEESVRGVLEQVCLAVLSATPTDIIDFKHDFKSISKLEIAALLSDRC